MTNLSTTAPSLRAFCTNALKEVRQFSGIREDVLEQASGELQTAYEIWCMDYKGPDLEDPFAGFQEMLKEWEAPWEPYDSSLDGLTLAQYYYLWAYGDAKSILGILGGWQMIGFGPDFSRVDYSARHAISATKALMHAKHLLTAKNPSQAQAAC